MSLEELSPKQQERYFKYLASLPLEKRLLMVFDVIDTARAFMEAGIRRLHPHASHREIQAHIAARLCGPEVARRCYGIEVELP
jgi:hypothetical protein